VIAANPPRPARGASSFAPFAKKEELDIDLGGEPMGKTHKSILRLQQRSRPDVVLRPIPTTNLSS
jgi:hypothetical protein